MSARTAATALLGVWALVGCGDTTSAAWRVRFEGDGGAVVAGAVRVRLRVLRGGCEGTDLVYEADVARADAVPVFGEIGEGAFGFEAVARDATCTIVARGCVAGSLPLAAGEELVTSLAPVSGAAPLCAPSECVDGRCVPTDAAAGAADAGSD